MEQIHEGHLGIEKCMLKARDSLFWPGISNDIRETVEKCGICQASSKAAKPAGNVSDVPPHTWHTLGTDLFLLEQDRLPGDQRLLLQVT